jgi:hypothetical protein
LTNSGAAPIKLIMRREMSCGRSKRPAGRGPKGRSVALDLAGNLPSGSYTVPILHLEGLSYVVPQRLALPDLGHGLKALQMGASRPVAGQLKVLADGAVIASRAVRTRPERCLGMPLEVMHIPPGTKQISATLEGC